MSCTLVMHRATQRASVRMLSKACFFVLSGDSHVSRVEGSSSAEDSFFEELHVIHRNRFLIFFYILCKGSQHMLLTGQFHENTTTRHLGVVLVKSVHADGKIRCLFGASHRR